MICTPILQYFMYSIELNSLSLYIYIYSGDLWGARFIDKLESLRSTIGFKNDHVAEIK